MASNRIEFAVTANGQRLEGTTRMARMAKRAVSILRGAKSDKTLDFAKGFAKGLDKDTVIEVTDSLGNSWKFTGDRLMEVVSNLTGNESALREANRIQKANSLIRYTTTASGESASQLGDAFAKLLKAKK